LTRCSVHRRPPYLQGKPEAFEVGQWIRVFTIVTTDTPFSDWGDILFNTAVAAAIGDRLEENSEIFLSGRPSLCEPKKPDSPAGKE
jgi:hypothetical protein